jgi:mono/diheme cytochrome c family protein
VKKILIRSILGIVGVVVLAVLLVAGVAQARWDRTFDETPMPELRASTDSAVVARGRYLAYGAAFCAGCHTTVDKARAIDAGVELPLSGGHVWDIPPGVIRSPNLTPASADTPMRSSSARSATAFATTDAPCFPSWRSRTWPTTTSSL